MPACRLPLPLLPHSCSLALAPSLVLPHSCSPTPTRARRPGGWRATTGAAGISQIASGDSRHALSSAARALLTHRGRRHFVAPTSSSSSSAVRRRSRDARAPHRPALVPVAHLPVPRGFSPRALLELPLCCCSCEASTSAPLLLAAARVAARRHDSGALPHPRFLGDATTPSRAHACACSSLDPAAPSRSRRLGARAPKPPKPPLPHQRTILIGRKGGSQARSRGGGAPAGAGPGGWRGETEARPCRHPLGSPARTHGINIFSGGLSRFRAERRSAVAFRISGGRRTSLPGVLLSLLSSCYCFPSLYARSAR